MPNLKYSLRFTFVLLFAFFLTACGGKNINMNSGSTKPYTIKGKTYYPLASADNFQEVGTASWYGPGFHGKTTASGETFNQNAMTAAHKILPFGTMVEVTNLNNGKSVQVKINDRGPFHQNRVIDLSRGAASRIDMVNTGVAKVRIVPVGSGRPQPLPSYPTVAAPTYPSQNQSPLPLPPVPSRGVAYLEVEIFPSIPEAESAATVLKSLGLPGRIIRTSKGFAVHSGPYASSDEAVKHISVLKHKFPQVKIL